MRNPAFSVRTERDSPGFLLWQVTALWQRGVRRTLAPHGLTHAQFVLAASLLWLGGVRRSPVTQAALSAHSKIDPMTVSAVLRTLASKGLVSRAKHPSDARANAVALTEEGGRVTRPAIRTVEKFDGEFFAALPGDPAGFNAELVALSSAGS